MTQDKLLAEWFWTDRWNGSSGFLLPMEARGVYREMLTQAWRRGAQLPNDHEAIRRAIGATVGEWRRAWPAVKKFWRVDGDLLVNDTQIEVYADAKGRATRASERGLRAAQAKHKQCLSTAQAEPEHSVSSTQAPLEHNPPSLSPSLRRTKDKEKAAATPPTRFHVEAPSDNVSVITKIAHEAIDVEGVKAELSHLADVVKSLCAIRGIAYDSTAVRKAVDSALVQRRRSA